MESESVVLPEAFGDLEPFAREWGHLKSADERDHKMHASSMDELRRYYDAVWPRLDAALTYLDTFPVDKELPAPELMLFRTVLAMAGISQVIEWMGAPEHVGMPEHRFHMKTVVDLKPV